MIKWENIESFEGYYKVSNTGYVKGIKRIVKHNYGGNAIKSEKLLHLNIVRGYVAVRLCKNGIVYDKRVHRLVASAFIPNPENKAQVNHKNGIKTDNRVENLEWCTPQENVIHSYKNGLSKKGSEHYNFGKVGYNATFAKCNKTGEILSSFELAARFKVSTVHINRMLSGTRTNKTNFSKVLEANPEMQKEIEEKMEAQVKN